jgi:hypothetical protein
MRSKKEIKDMHNVVHCLFEILEEDDEGNRKDNTEEECDKGTLLDYMDVFNWLNEEPTMLEDILTDFAKKYAPESMEE